MERGEEAGDDELRIDVALREGAGLLDGSKGIGEPVLGAAAAAYVCAVSNALGTRFNRMPILPDMIVNEAENQPQSYKPLEVLV